MSDGENNIENDMEAMNMDTDRDKIRRLDEERRRKREETIRRAREARRRRQTGTKPNTAYGDITGQAPPSVLKF